MPTFTSVKTRGELLLRFESPEYCFESTTITNGGGSAITLKVGSPVVVATGVECVAADVANLTGITLDPVTLQAGETKKVLCLTRGPAVIKESGLPTTDFAGASFNMTNFKNAILALDPKILIVAPLANES